jgi:hypothetical protein
MWYKEFRTLTIAGSLCALGLLALATAFAAETPRCDALPTGSASHAVAPQNDSSAFAVTVQYVTHFYPLWFSYNQSRLNELVGTSNRMAGPAKMAPGFRFVVASNDDTLYASAFLDLTAEPAILTVPATTVSYSILVVDRYGNIIPVAAAQPGVYALTGPGFSGALPPGITRIALPVNFPIMFVRADKFASSGEDQTAEATAFRKALRMQPLKPYLADPSGGTTKIVPAFLMAASFKSTADDLIERTPILFLKQLQKAVAAPNTPPLSPAEQELSSRFDALFSNKQIPWSDFRDGARKAHQSIQDAYLTHTGSTNWIHFRNIGNWGDNVLDRAAITEFLQFSNGISTAAYYHAFRDEAGHPLNGSETQSYVLTFPGGQLPRAKRFWSLTAYTPKTIEVVRNPANKYVVASYTPGLQHNKDGSISIYMAKRPPAGAPISNWLPIPDGPFNVMLRIYGPEGAVADNTYVPPGIKKQ